MKMRVLLCTAELVRFEFPNPTGIILRIENAPLTDMTYIFMI